MFETNLWLKFAQSAMYRAIFYKKINTILERLLRNAIRIYLQFNINLYQFDFMLIISCQYQIEE